MFFFTKLLIAIKSLKDKTQQPSLDKGQYIKEAGDHTF